jgi:hypothetical protein
MDLTMDQVRGICSIGERETCGEELLYQSQIDFRVPTSGEFREPFLRGWRKVRAYL